MELLCVLNPTSSNLFQRAMQKHIVKQHKWAWKLWTPLLVVFCIFSVLRWCSTHSEWFSSLRHSRPSLHANHWDVYNITLIGSGQFNISSLLLQIQRKQFMMTFQGRTQTLNQVWSCLDWSFRSSLAVFCFGCKSSLWVCSPLGPTCLFSVFVVSVLTLCGVWGLECLLTALDAQRAKDMKNRSKGLKHRS